MEVVPAVAVVLQKVGVGGLGAGGDNGPAHTPASRGTHMHAWDHLHAWGPAACPPHSRVPRPGPRAHGFRGRTAQSRITARHADAFLLSPYMSSPPLFNFWVHSLPFHRWFRLSLSLRVFASTRGNYHVTCGAITSMLQESKLKQE